jgi:uncharacterized protein
MISNTITANQLFREKSPYLLQHKDNPIWWRAWNDATCAEVKNLDRPVFLSIGYATCHWCHVMEGDSFEDEGVAAVLNRHFVSIKVDREERPDVDAIYMSAVLAMTGRGGWPMTILMTPDFRPFWAGTFLRRDQLLQLLQQIVEIWNSPRRSELLQSSEHIYKHLVREPVDTIASVSTKEVKDTFIRQLRESFDDELGGFGNAPKFPPAMALMGLMRVYKQTSDVDLLAMVETTLNAMARGGMYDQLGGGFHRYSVDERWQVPHFEKMLYDNALLALSYSEAYQLTKNEDYGRIATETLRYVCRDLMLEEGGFASAEDADSENTEGKFYCWQWTELQEILDPDEFRLFATTYHVEESGNFIVDRRVAELEKAAGMLELEHANVLFVGKDEPLPDLSDQILKKACEKAIAKRKQRPRPLRDDKILTSWNGLAIGALARCAQVFENKEFLDAALRAAQFVCQHLKGGDGSLLRRYCGGEAGMRATLEDYSFLVFGLYELYEATFDATWLVKAQALQCRQDEDFWDESKGCYFDTDGKDPSLIFRPLDIHDGPIPSGNSMSAYNLTRLGRLSGDLSCIERARSIIKAVGASLAQRPIAYPFLFLTLDMLADESKKELALPCSPNDPEVQSFLKAYRQEFLPNTLIACGLPSQQGGAVPLLAERPDEEKFTVYICENFVCQLPTDGVAEALHQIIVN